MATLLRVPLHKESWRIGIARLLRPHEAAPLADRAAAISRFRSLALADAVAQAVAHLAYVPDPDSLDLWRSPARTLEDGGGDCEDLALAAASALIRLGVPADVVVGRIWTGEEWALHAWVEGDDGYGAFLLEATNASVFRRERPWQYSQLARNGTLGVRAA